MIEIQDKYEEMYRAYHRCATLSDVILHILLTHRGSTSMHRLRKALSCYEARYSGYSLQQDYTDQDIARALTVLLSDWTTHCGKQYRLQIVIKNNQIKFQLPSREIPT